MTDMRLDADSASSTWKHLSTNTELSRDGVYCGEGERDESPTAT